MGLHNFSPSDLIENLKCFVCDNYLSYFPISLCCNSQSVCGRCTVPEGVICFQNEALEMVCLQLKFPCRYQGDGCPEQLSPEDVPNHEQACPFRIVACMLNKPKPCEWIGSLPTLVQHCKEAHAESFVESGSEFELNLVNCDERDYVVENGDSFVIFTEKFDCDNKILEFAVYNSEYMRAFEIGICQLKVSCGDTTITHDFDGSTFTEKIYSTVCLPFIKDDVDHSVPLAKIRVGDSDSVDGQNRGTIAKRAGFICVYCSNFALPPIFRRTIDMAVICYSCGGAGRRCSHCTIPKRIRDPILEQFAVLETYPCMYQSNGCKYTSTHAEMIKHQTSCAYETSRCPIYDTQCKWEGASKDIEHHVGRQHPEFMMDLGEQLEFSVRGVTYHQRVLKFRKQLFMMIYVLEEKKFVWIVQPLGQCEEKFSYEISIFDIEDGGFIASMRRLCEKWVNLEVFSKIPCASYFGIEQLLRESSDKEAIMFTVQIARC